MSTSSTKFVFWGRSKNKMAVMASYWIRHYQLLLWNRWMEFNETWEEARSQRHLPSLCFWDDRRNKMAALASDWLGYFQLLWKHWTKFSEILKEARSQRPLPTLCFGGRSEKQDGHPLLWLAETFSTFPLKPLNGIQRNLSGSKISTSSTKFVFRGRSEKQDGRPGLLLDETLSTSPLKPLNGIQRNLKGSKISTSSTKFVFLGRSEKQDGRSDLWLAETFSTSLKQLNKIQRILPGSKISTSSTKFFFVLFSGGSVKQDDRPGFWLAETFLFYFFFWNRWTEFNETWQEVRSQCPLPSLWGFFCWSENQDVHPSHWLAETFSTSPLKPLNGIQRTFSTWQDARSQRPLPCLCFWTYRKNKLATQANQSTRMALYSGARYLALLASCLIYQKINQI